MNVWRQRKTLLFLLLFALFGAANLAAQTAPSSGPGRLGDDLTLKIAVIGPGDELYFWWGHIGLVIEDRVSGRTRFYDWGVFSFENENFFVNFAFGRLIYSCVVSWAGSNFATYVRTNRDITLYTLDLPADVKEKVLFLAENNMLPENRDYAYHHFRDNCATRIRDILDIALDGQFKAEFGDAPGRYTLRDHVRRHTWFNPFFDWMLNFLMGQDIDRPITVWEDMFLPSEIGTRIRNFSYIGPDGKERPLVSGVETLNESSGRPAVLDVPRALWPPALLCSLLLAGLLLLLYRLWGTRKGFRIAAGMVQSAAGLFFGIAGSVLFFMTFFTNHDYTYHNSNILFVNPLLLAAVPLGILFAFTKNEKRRFIAARLLRTLWLCVLLGALLAMVIKLFPAFYQENQVTLALLAPLALVFFFLMARMGRFSRSRPAAPQ